MRQNIQIDPAGPHHLGGVRFFGQGQQQVFKRRKFMLSLVCQRQGCVNRLFKRI